MDRLAQGSTSKKTLYSFCLSALIKYLCTAYHGLLPLFCTRAFLTLLSPNMHLLFTGTLLGHSMDYAANAKLCLVLGLAVKSRDSVPVVPNEN